MSTITFIFGQTVVNSDFFVIEKTIQKTFKGNLTYFKTSFVDNKIMKIKKEK